MNADCLKALEENWNELPILDKQGFMTEGLHEYAHLMVLRACSGLSLNDVAGNFRHMTPEQIEFFMTQIEEYVISILPEKGHGEFKNRWVQYRQQLS